VGGSVGNASVVTVIELVGTSHWRRWLVMFPFNIMA
jgi:hypothetical protein